MADVKEHPTPETATPTHDRRDRLLGLRLSQAEIDAIRVDAVRYGLSPADYCRRVLLLPLTIRETAARIKALTGAAARDPTLAAALTDAVKPALDAWQQVLEAEQVVHNAKMLLASMVHPAKPVLEALNLMDGVTKGRTKGRTS